MTMAIFIKENNFIGAAYIFRGLLHCHHGETWQHAGRCIAGEGAEIPIS